MKEVRMEKVLGKLQSGSDIRGIAIQYEDKEVNLKIFFSDLIRKYLKIIFINIIQNLHAIFYD